MAYKPGNIPLSANFNVAIAKPIDSKFTVPLYADLATIPYPYAGLRTYVEETEITYVLQNDLVTWEILGGGSSVTKESFTATNNQTVFTLTDATATVMVYIGRNLAIEGLDYTYTSPTITLGTGALPGQIITVLKF